jgi:hypothetical protein
MVYRWALLLILMQRALARRLWTVAYFNLRVVNMRQHLGLSAHVEQRCAARAFRNDWPRFDLAAHRTQSGSTWRHGLML